MNITKKCYRKYKMAILTFSFVVTWKKLSSFILNASKVERGKAVGLEINILFTSIQLQSYVTVTSKILKGWK